MQLGEYEKALNDFQIGQKIDNNGVMQDLLYNEIVAYEKLGQFSKAEEMMQSYLKSYPDDQDAQREQLFLQTR
ncbi:MAG: tetratricopeptide repeat protein [Lachnospiraceae bacterium]|nr:tetratricopeptide repeat protein [Lachnospiraceae bacterium]